MENDQIMITFNLNIKVGWLGLRYWNVSDWIEFDPFSQFSMFLCGIATYSITELSNAVLR